MIKIKNFLLFTLLSLIALSCQKEKNDELTQINSWQEFKATIVQNTETAPYQQGTTAQTDSIQVIGTINETMVGKKISLVEIQNLLPQYYGPVYEVCTIFGKERKVEIGDLHTACGEYQQLNQPATVQIFKGSEKIATWDTQIQVQWDLGEPANIGEVATVKIFLP